jgi:predicted RNase H-like HicB family nuclease
MDDGVFCASISLLKGCKGYGETASEAIEELLGVKDSLIELLYKQKRSLPEPTIHLEIPVNEFSRMRNKKKLQQFVQTE